MVAVSYDSIEILSAFATEQSLTFPLLSDSGSLVIERLGLLNHVIEAELRARGREPMERHRGLPFPGTFLLDEEGRTIDRKFARSHRVRESASLLLSDLLDEESVPAVSGTASGGGVHAEVWAGQQKFFPGQRQYLRARLQLADGGLLVPPVSAGLTPLVVSLEPPAFLSEGVFEPPPGEPMAIEGVSESLHVVREQVELVLPFYVADDVTSDVDLAVAIDFQTCNGTAINPPGRFEIHLPMQYRPLPRP